MKILILSVLILIAVLKSTADELTKWVGKLSLAGDKLIIRDIGQDHFVTITCKMTKSLGTTVGMVTYKILKLDVTANPLTPLLPGESLSLSCKAESPQGQKQPQIHWLNPQQERSNNQKQLIEKVTSQHDGQWICVVTNDGEKKEVKVSVTVIDLTPAPASPQYTSQSSYLKIPCSFPDHISWEQIKAKGLQEGSWHFVPKPDSSPISGEPQRLFSLSLEDQLTWKPQQSRGLTLSNSKPQNLALTRNQGREDDSGDYECSLRFKSGVTLKRTVRVEVLQIVSSLGTEFISGQQLNLTCSLGHPLSSDLRLKWIPPKQLSLSSLLTSDHHPARLIIPEVGTGHGGRWKCELWQRSTCLTSAVITLKIEPKLKVWMLVIICSVTVIVILLLLLLVFILYRRRQRKTTHLRHRLCQCKNPKPKGFYRT
ncbi:CD4-1 molecule [Symphorus nematophorus]